MFWHLTCEWAYIIWVFPSYHDAAVFWLCAFDYDARFKVQNGVSFKGIACVKMRPQRFIWEGITALENSDLRVPEIQKVRPDLGVNEYQISRVLESLRVSNSQVRVSGRIIFNGEYHWIIEKIECVSGWLAHKLSGVSRIHMQISKYSLPYLNSYSYPKVKQLKPSYLYYL